VHGAFAESLAGYQAKGRMPAFLWAHDQASPIGMFKTVKEDTKGLYVEGQFALTTVRGAEAHSLVKMGAVTGMSIGYRTREDSVDRLTRIRRITKADLYEVSAVAIPMNDESRIEHVKSIEDLQALSDCEAWLRDVARCSRSEATAFVSRIKAIAIGRQGDPESSDARDLEAVLASLRRLNSKLTGASA